MGLVVRARCSVGVHLCCRPAGRCPRLGLVFKVMGRCTGLCREARCTQVRRGRLQVGLWLCHHATDVQRPFLPLRHLLRRVAGVEVASELERVCYEHVERARRTSIACHRAEATTQPRQTTLAVEARWVSKRVDLLDHGEPGLLGVIVGTVCVVSYLSDDGENRVCPRLLGASWPRLMAWTGPRSV